jgi:hypothetical protein
MFGLAKSGESAPHSQKDFLDEIIERLLSTEWIERGADLVLITSIEVTKRISIATLTL